jgi:hypothetical protein
MSNGGIIVFNFAKMWKKAGVTYLRHYFRIFLENLKLK